MREIKDDIEDIYETQWRLFKWRTLLTAFAFICWAIVMALLIYLRGIQQALNDVYTQSMIGIGAVCLFIFLYNAMFALRYFRKQP